MVMNPTIQKRVQEEMDAVLSQTNNVLPSFEILERLLYLNAVINETMRWKPIVPLGKPIYLIDDKSSNNPFTYLGVARKTTTEDWYKGKYSLIISNIVLS